MSECVFLSHASENLNFTWQLSSALAGLGVASWYDSRDIGAGTAWDRSVEEALQRCPYLAVILTPSAVASPNVMDEVVYALDRGKGVIAVLREDCEIPYRLGRLEVVDCRKKAPADCALAIAATLQRLGLESIVPLDHDLWPDAEPASGPPEIQGMAVVMPKYAARVAYYSLPPHIRRQVTPEQVRMVIDRETEWLDNHFDIPEWDVADVVDDILEEGNIDLNREQVEAILEGEEIYMDILSLIERPDESEETVSYPPVGPDASSLQPFEQAIFICYAEEDLDFATQLVEMLTSADYRTWFGRWDLPGAADPEAIQARALDTCNHIVVILSPAAVTSQQVTDLWSYALNRGKTLFPIMYKTTQLPFRLERLNFIDLRGDIGLNIIRLYTALDKVHVAKDPGLAAFSELHRLAVDALDAAEFEEALSLLDRALEAYPRSLEARTDRAMVFKELGFFECALQELEGVLQIDPDYPPALAVRGVTLLAIDDLQGAMAVLDRAIELRSDDGTFHRERGRVLLLLGDFAAADAALAQAIRLAPGDSSAYDLKSQALLEMDDIDGALEASAEAVRLDPDDPFFFRNRYFFLLLAGENEEALSAGRWAMELDPGFAPDYSACGAALSAMGRYEEALAEYNEALRLDPEIGGLYLIRGKILLELDHLNEALVDLDRAVELFPDDAEAHFQRGWALSLLNRTDAAISALREALRLEPDNEYYQDMLEELMDM